MTLAQKRDLISIEDLTNDEIEEIFRIADGMLPENRSSLGSSVVANKIMATLFYEPSTRTRLSFESAMQRLGGSVISSPDMKSSSAAKGESISDTARVVSSYADVLVVRHYWDGAAKVMADYAGIPVINAGDGSHEHPTQTLCDLYTLKREKSAELKDLTVVISGDLKHGRTIHSLIYALARFGVHLVTLPAKGMDLPQYVKDKLERDFRYTLAPAPANDLQSIVKKTDAIYLTPSKPNQQALFPEITVDIQIRLQDRIPKIDAFYVTRKQSERMKEEKIGEDDYPKLGSDFLKNKRFTNTVVMHPLPRVDELSYDIDRDKRGIYFKQAAYGVPIRMALLQFLLDKARVNKPPTKTFLAYERPAGLRCSNTNCVTRTEPQSAPLRFETLFKESGRKFVVRCCYCDHQVNVHCVGHTSSKKYWLYEFERFRTVSEWLAAKELAIFESIKQAEELGYKPYKRGPQKKIMDERDIQKALDSMSEAIWKETEDHHRLLLAGIRTKGVFLAKRIAAYLQRKLGHEIEIVEVDLTSESLHKLSPLDSEIDSINVTNRPVILVDDVIFSGITANTAMNIISRLGHFQFIRLAVLVDRGHRTLPVKPVYVGKSISSSEGERVEVLLHETNLTKKDQVVMYSIVNPIEQHTEGLGA
jgi:aspartate carbamoyltransferase catalytic subunit